jgi:hypothetical protein
MKKPSIAFPTIIDENFFDDPDRVVELANSLEYHPSEGKYPGSRSEMLADVAPEFFHHAINRWMSLYFDWVDPGIKMQWNAEAYFQRIDSFDDDKDSPYNQGWIHQDDNYVVASVVYLDKDSNSNQGTSICYPAKEYTEDQAIRKSFYADGIRSAEYEAEMEKCQESFEETIIVNNQYNRLISFDSNNWHKARSFYSKDNKSRLTLVMFCNSIESTCAPPFGRKQMIKWS